MIDELVGWLSDLVEWFVEFVGGILTYILDSLLGLFLSFVYFLYDTFLSCIESFISALSLPDFMINAAASWAGLPPAVSYCLNAVGIGQILVILGAAYALRFALNLIPGVFTRV